MTSPTVAFIGLGNMGGPMAANLVRAGYAVRGHDVSAEARASAREAGVATVAGSAQAVTDADVVFTMLPNGRILLDLYGTGEPGSAGLLGAARPGTLFVDCSTVDVADARVAHDRALAAGHRAVDAPVSGGTGGATAGTLTFMCGGEAADIERVRPLLEVMGATIVPCGDSGAGQAAKICNNMILGISMIAVSEAFVLGEALGLSHEALYRVAARSSGQCWALTTNCPVPGPVPTSPANRDYRPGFMGGLMAKDLGLALNAIEDTGVAARLGPLAAGIYREFAAGEGAGQDFSGIIVRIRAESGAGITAASAASGK